MNWLRALRYARRYRNWRELELARSAQRKPARAVLRDGTTFEAPHDVNVLRVVTPVFHKHVYTPRGFELRGDDTVVDVGANIGAFAVFAAQRTRGRVLAVEPHPANAAALRKNLAANGAAHAEVAECALADAPGTLPLFLGRTGTTHQLHAVGKDAGDGESIDVRVTTLPDLLAEHRIAARRLPEARLRRRGGAGAAEPAARALRNAARDRARVPRRCISARPRCARPALVGARLRDVPRVGRPLRKWDAIRPALGV